MKKVFIIGTLFIILVWLACSRQKQTSTAELVQQYYIEQVLRADSAVKSLRDLIKTDAPQAELQTAFKDARLAYKRTEFLAEYYTPLTAKSINGAPIPSMDENDQHKVDEPEGFQVIEPFLFPAYNVSDKEELLKQAEILVSNFKRLQVMAKSQQLADAQVFDAMRTEVFRVITLGISGFDAAIAQNSMAEGASALTSLKHVLLKYKKMDKADSELYGKALANLDKSVCYLEGSRNFNSFNRMEFIIRHANPLSVALAKCAQTLKIDRFPESRALKASAGTLFDKDAFNVNFYTSGFDAHTSAAKVALGKRLFYDPVLSGTGKRTCASCHQPQKAFTDGLPKSSSIDGKSSIRRNTPTILNAALQPMLFYDNRVAYLEDQATDVINNQDEMHGSLPHAISKLKLDSSYTRMFRNAFAQAKQPMNEYNLRNAIGSYIRSLVFLNSPFDKYVGGDLKQLTRDEINGFNLYMGKAKCATCHFMPLFNGTVPPDYRAIETEVIGVPVAANINKIDNDKGKYELRKLKLYQYAFRTPGIRNIAFTAPYMHNGIYKTLEEVVDFYNNGGGAGLGIKLENQTLPFDKLNLTDKEKKDIVGFLKKLNDVTGR